MLWVKLLFVVLIIISQMYLLRFQSSAEGKDERGKEIQYKSNSMLFHFLYLGMIALIVLHLIDVIPTKIVPDLLLYLTVSLSVFGSIFVYINKNKQNY
ncbi:hypothetical protein QPK24_01975 [Paenibacillus polygoni]|uniref:Group-specific protein n=1 Tax=Paenibacillus polygoni TaxID=3050112 RepID=A0ABY8X3C5_9BACL|nr:hypothetical protein [Paenibacillus polygoni]WIV19543.1 hypothetical protein QPK24_01975 [Paenibacillus polygoni]